MYEWSRDGGKTWGLAIGGLLRNRFEGFAKLAATFLAKLGLLSSTSRPAGAIGRSVGRSVAHDENQAELAMAILISAPSGYCGGSQFCRIIDG
jgi:hypothetical protein